MARILVFTALLVAAAYADCPNYDSESWIAVVGTNCYTSKVYTANLTNNDYCYDSVKYTLKTHVSLADAKSSRQSDSVGDVHIGTKNCGLNETNIKYCESHCMDKDIESALVAASMKISDNYNSIWHAALDNMKSLGKSDWPLLFFEPFEQHSEVDFQYYNDMNFCVVDVTFVLPAGDYYPAWPFRSFFVTHETLPTN